MAQPESRGARRWTMRVDPLARADRRPPRGTRQGAVWAALAVAVGAALWSVAIVLRAWRLSPDAIEHLAIAQSWIHGRGFVDPVQWNYYLPDGPPLPGFAVRPPVVPLLLSIPLALGASVTRIEVVHALWSAAIAGAVVLTARRFMRPPAALATGIGFAWSPAWILVSASAWTETTAVGAMLIVVLTARGVVRSHSHALLCSVATLVAWMTRPNLGLLLIAVVVAVVGQLGWRRAARHGPLWSYVLGFAAMGALVDFVTRWLTGYAPYAGYGFIGQILMASDGWQFQRSYPGTAEFVRAHFDEITRITAIHARELARVLFLDGRYHAIGWLALPAIAYALRRRAPIETRVAAFAALGFTAVMLATYATFDAGRYPVLPVAASWLCVGAMLDATATALERRLGTRARWLPVAVSLSLFCVFSAGLAAHDAEGALRRPRPTAERYPPRDAAARRFCPAIERGAIVASPEPWAFLLWCGNAGLRVPSDLASEVWIVRFLAAKRPRYFVLDREPAFAALKRSPRLVERMRYGGRGLYEVREGPHAAWHAPPPLACAGKDEACRRRLGR